MEVLKKFALNATTASLSEREQLFNDLFNLLDSQRKNEPNSAEQQPSGNQVFEKYSTPKSLTLGRQWEKKLR